VSRDRLKLIAPLAILGSGVLVAFVLIATRPAVPVQLPEVPRPLVRVIDVAPGEHVLKIRTHGTVTPRTATDLVAEVAGTVKSVSPALVSGGVFETGEVLLALDRAEYEVAVERARALLARAKSEHQRAVRDLERQRKLAAKDIASPAQLEDAQSAEEVAAAMLREATAGLRQAELDLTRTELRAPYMGRVREESVDVGQFVSRGTRIARIYAIDFAEVRLPVPDQELAFVELPGLLGTEAEPERAPRVSLRAQFAGRPQVWEGRIVRTEGEIDPRSRMVYVVARVEDPYGIAERDSSAAAAPGAPFAPLAVGLFVEAEIVGRTLDQAFVLPRAALREDDRVWVVGPDDRLRVRPVTVLRRSGDRVVVTDGLAAGERVCVSTLQAVVDGMPVRTAASPPSAIASGPPEPAP